MLQRRRDLVCFHPFCRERESKLASFNGFEEFLLLRLDSDVQEGGEGESTASKEGYAEFISHTTWAHKLDFLDWKNRSV